MRLCPVALAVDLADELPRVIGAPRRMEQVLVNLLLNACRAVPDEGGEISLWAESTRKIPSSETTALPSPLAALTRTLA